MTVVLNMIGCSRRSKNDLMSGGEYRSLQGLLYKFVFRIVPPSRVNPIRSAPFGGERKCLTDYRAVDTFPVGYGPLRISTAGLEHTAAGENAPSCSVIFMPQRRRLESREIQRVYELMTYPGTAGRWTTPMHGQDDLAEP